MMTASDLIKYAEDAVGGGYCWGSEGQVCSHHFRTELAQRAPDQAENLLNLCKKWDGRKVWDCSGLFRGAWTKLHSRKSGGATTIYSKWCRETGPIGTMPDEPGIAVFRGVLTPKLNMAHIGLYVGDGMVIDARGSAKGVMHGPLSSVAWSHWGRLADVIYEGKAVPAQEKALYQARQMHAEKGLNLRPSPSLHAATKFLIPKDAVVDVCLNSQGPDKSFDYVKYMSVYGYCTHAYLTRLLPEEEPETSEMESREDAGFQAERESPAAGNQAGSKSQTAAGSNPARGWSFVETPEDSQATARPAALKNLSLMVYPPSGGAGRAVKVIAPIQSGDRVVIAELGQGEPLEVYAADVNTAGMLVGAAR